MSPCLRSAPAQPSVNCSGRIVCGPGPGPEKVASLEKLSPAGWVVATVCWGFVTANCTGATMDTDPLTSVGVAGAWVANWVASTRTFVSRQVLLKLTPPDG